MSNLDDLFAQLDEGGTSGSLDDLFAQLDAPVKAPEQKASPMLPKGRMQPVQQQPLESDLARITRPRPVETLPPVQDRIQRMPPAPAEIRNSPTTIYQSDNPVLNAALGIPRATGHAVEQVIQAATGFTGDQEARKASERRAQGLALASPIPDVEQGAGSMIAISPFALINPALGAAAAGGLSMGPAIGEGAEAGLSTAEQWAYGAGHGGLEYLTERMPLGILFGKGGRSAVERVMRAMFPELATEQIATLTQDAWEKSVIQPNKTWGEYLAERPEAAKRTALATLGGLGAAGAVMGTAQAMERPSAARMLSEGLDQQYLPKLPDNQFGPIVQELYDRGRTRFTDEAKRVSMDDAKAQYAAEMQAAKDRAVAAMSGLDPDNAADMRTQNRAMADYMSDLTEIGRKYAGTLGTDAVTAGMGTALDATMPGEYAGPQGYAQQEAAPEVEPEQEAQAIQPQPASPARPARPSDNLLRRINQLGGINMRYLPDVAGESKVRRGMPVGLFRKNGMGLDDLARMLADEGFPINIEDPTDTDGVRQLTELLQRVLSGGVVLNQWGQQAQIDAMLKAEAEIQAQAAQEARDDPEAIAEREAIQQADVAIQGVTNDELNALLDAAFNNERTPNAIPSDAEIDQLFPPAQDAQASQSDVQEEGALEGSPEAGPFALDAYTPDDLRQREVQPEQAQPDVPSPADFTLTGSNRQADEAEARGQIELAPAELARPVTISKDAIPALLATAAFNGTSHTPERRGESARQDYVNTLEALWGKFEDKYNSANDDIKAAFVEAFNDIANKYGALYRNYLASHARVVSAFIAGPANFPAARMNKRSESADKRANEANEYIQKAQARLTKVLRGKVDNSVQSALAEAKEKLAQREAAQEKMKQANAALRKGDDAALEALGYTATQIAQLKKPDFARRIGFADFSLKNNNAEIRRMRARVQELEGRIQEGETAPEEQAGPVRIVRNVEEGRLQLFFDGKPDEATRDALKSRGFRWSPKNGAWQRQLTDSAVAAAEQIVADVKFSRQSPGKGMTVEAATAHLRKRFGKRIDRMLEAGTLEIVATPRPEWGKGQRGIGGAWDGKTAWIVASQASPETLAATYLHEVGEHAGMEEMLGDRYQDIITRLDDLIWEGDETANRAASRVPKDTQAKDVQHERLAYFIEEAQRARDSKPQTLSTKARQLLQDILAAIRAWAYRKFGGITLTEADILAMARQSAKRVADQSGVKLDTMREAEAQFSKEPQSTDAEELARKFGFAVKGQADAAVQTMAERAYLDNEEMFQRMKRGVVSNKDSMSVGEALAAEVNWSPESVDEWMREAAASGTPPVDILAATMAMSRTQSLKLLSAQTPDQFVQATADVLHVLMATRAYGSEMGRALQFIGAMERMGGYTPLQAMRQGGGLQQGENVAPAPSGELPFAPDVKIEKEFADEAADAARNVLETGKFNELQAKTADVTMSAEEYAVEASKAETDLLDAERRLADALKARDEARAKRTQNRAALKRAESGTKEAQAAEAKHKANTVSDADVLAAEQAMDAAKLARNIAFKRMVQMRRLLAKAKAMRAKAEGATATHNVAATKSLQATTHNIASALTVDSLRNALGGDKGVRKLMEFIKQQGNNLDLGRLVSYLSAMADGIKQQAQRDADRGRITKFMDAWMELFQANILTGLFTHEINVTSNAANLLLELGFDQVIKAGLGGKAGVKGLVAGYRELGEVRKLVADIYALMKYNAFEEMPAHRLTHLLAQKDPTLLALMQGDEIKWRDSKSKHLPGMFGKVVRTYGYVPLGIEDAVFKVILYKFELARQRGAGEAQDIKRAIEFAKEGTFQSDFQMPDWMHHWAMKGVGVLFMKTMMNLIRRTLQHIPVAGQIVERKALAGKRDEDAQRAAIARGISGVLISALLWNAIGDDDEEEAPITGYAPFERRERALWMMDRDQVALRIGDTSYPLYRLDPAAGIIGLNVAAKHAANTGDADQAAKELANGMYQSVVSKHFMQTFVDLVEGLMWMAKYKVPQEEAEDELVYQAPGATERIARGVGKHILSTLIPNMVPQVGDMTDEYKRKTRDIEDDLKRKFPMLREELPELLDASGHPVGEPRFHSPFPVNSKPAKRDEVARWQMKLDKMLEPDPISIRKLPPEERKELLQRRWDLITLAYEVSHELPVEFQRKALDKAKDAWSKQVRGTILMHRAELLSDKEAAAANLAGQDEEDQEGED